MSLPALSEVVVAASGAPAVRRRRRRWGGLLAVLAVVAIPSGVINHGDGGARYAETKALVLRGSTVVPPAMAHEADGRTIAGLLPVEGGFASKFGIGVSLLWAGPVAAALALHRATGVPFEPLARFAVSLVNPVVLVLTVWVLLAVMRRLQLGRAARGWAVKLFLVGTSALPYANTAFSEPVAGLLLLLACTLPVVRPGVATAAASGVLVTLLVLVKPDLALVPACLLPLFLLGAGGRGRARRVGAHGLAPALVFLAVAALGAAQLLAANQLLRGGALRFSYGAESMRFGSPWTGLDAYLFGIDRSLLLFNAALPLAAASWWIVARDDRRWRSLGAAVAVLWAVYLPFYASWWAWDGGQCFGPRFFQSFVPVTMLPAGAAVVHLRAAVRRPVAARAFLVAALALVGVAAPFQLAGLGVKDAQTVAVARATGRSEQGTRLRLLALKLGRGPGAPEVYRGTDFVPPTHAAADRVFDFRDKPTFQWLNHWWAIVLANRLRGGTLAPDPVPGAGPG